MYLIFYNQIRRSLLSSFLTPAQNGDRNKHVDTLKDQETSVCCQCTFCHDPHECWRKMLQSHKRTSPSIVMAIFVIVVVLAKQPPVSAAFHTGSSVEVAFVSSQQKCSGRQKRNTNQISALKKNNDLDDLDGIGNTEAGRDDISNGGKDIAKNFYEQLEKLNNKSASIEINEEFSFSKRTSSSSGRESDYALQQNPVLISRLVDYDDDDVKSATTSRDPRTFVGTSSLFSDDMYSSSSVKQTQMEREFDLAGNFEKTLLIQAGLLFAALVFVISVGFTGGITDGSNRYFGGADEITDSPTILEDYWS